MEELTAIILGFFGITAASIYGVLLMIWVFFLMISIIMGMGLFIFWIIALIDCIKRDNKDFTIGGEHAKLVWILILVLVRSITPIIYYLLIMQKKQKSKKKISRKKKK